MSKAKEIISMFEQEEGPADLKSVLNELDFGISSEFDHSAQNLSTGTEAASLFELANDQGNNYIEFSLWDKNRFDTAIGSVRYVMGMKAVEGLIELSTGKGIERDKFNSKDDDIESIPDIIDKEAYKDKINRIRRILLGFSFRIRGITGVANDPNGFEQWGHKIAQGLLHKCSPYMKK